MASEYKSIYEMGSKTKLKREDCSYIALAIECLKLKYKAEGSLGDLREEDIIAEAKEYAKIFYREDNGYLKQIKKYLKIDLELLNDNLRFQSEKYKILFLLFRIKNIEYPNREIIELIAEYSMENIDNSLLGWKSYNGEVVKFIKDELEKELEEQTLKNIKNAIGHISSHWDKLVDEYRYQMDVICSEGDIPDFDEIINRLYVALLKITRGNEVKMTFSELSPIALFYLRILQFEQIGQIKDILYVNNIEIKSDYSVPLEMVEEMKKLNIIKVDINNIEKHIDNNIERIVKYVYLTNDIKKNDCRKVRYNKGKVTKLIEFCMRARPLLVMKEVSELFVISCLQAILLDCSNEKFDYKFHGYQKYMKHKPQVQGALKGDKVPADALRIYWVRKVVDRFYANIGRYDSRCKLREVENICDNILLEIFMSDDISEMLTKDSVFYDLLDE